MQEAEGNSADVPGWVQMQVIYTMGKACMYVITNRLRKLHREITRLKLDSIIDHNTWWLKFRVELLKKTTYRVLLLLKNEVKIVIINTFCFALFHEKTYCVEKNEILDLQLFLLANSKQTFFVLLFYGYKLGALQFTIPLQGWLQSRTETENKNYHQFNQCFSQARK